MSKFVIECPQCGKYAEAKTGFFAQKKIDCTCGYTINVRMVFPTAYGDHSEAHEGEGVRKWL